MERDYSNASMEIQTPAGAKHKGDHLPLPHGLDVPFSFPFIYTAAFSNFDQLIF